MSNRQESVLLKRQKVLADFGDFALQSENLDEVLTQACRLVAEAMGTRRAKVLEIEEGGRSLLVRAGVGWDPDIVGRTRIEMNERSSESFSIREKKPVISRDIKKEERFDVPDFMREAGVAALANVPIFLPGGLAYGLLQVDDTEPHDFDEDDTQFLRTYATILGPVIDRLFKLRDLRLTEERFRLTVEEASDYAIIITDKDDRITDWLPGATEVFGWSAEEAKGQPGSVVFTPEDREAGQDTKEIDTARREGVAPNVRWHQRKDGSRVFIEGSVRALRDGRGEVTGFIKIGQDVTQRREADEALHEKEVQQAFLLGLSDVLRATDDLAEIQKTAMRILGEHLEVSRAYYFRAEQDHDGSRAHIIEDGYQRDTRQPSNVGRHSLKAFGSWLFDGFERGEVVAISDVDDVDGLSDAERETYRMAGVTAFINVPLLRHGVYSAGIAVHDTKPRSWTDAQIDLIREVAARTWEAVERARAEALRRRAEEFNDLLVRFSDAVRGLVDPHAVAEAACRIVVEKIGAERAYWAEVDWATREYVVGAAVHGEGVPVIAGRFPVDAWEPFTSLHLAGQPVVVSDTQADARIPPAVKEGYAAIAVGADLAVPVVVNGRLRCTFAVNQRIPRQWTAEEVALVSAIAGRCWSEVERARAEAAVRTSEERKTFLLALGDAMRVQPDAHAVMEVGARLLGERLNASRIMFAEYDHARGIADIFHGWFADGAAPFPTIMQLRDYEGPILADLRSGRTVRIDNAGPPFERPDLAAIAELGVKALLSPPLIVNGKLVMNLSVHQHEARHWTDDEVALVQEVAERLWADLVRVRAEAALRASEERFRSFAENSTDVLWIVNADTRQLEYLSPSFARMWGEGRDRVMADLGRWLELVHPEDRGKAALVLPRAFDGESAMLSYRIVRPFDGAVRWIQDTGFPIRDDKGRITRVGGISQDLTDRTRIEQEVRAKRRELRIIVATIPQLVWRAVDGGHWIWASPQWTEFTGQSDEASHGWGWLEPVHPDDREGAQAAWKDAEKLDRFEAEYRLRNRDGVYRWFQTRATPIHSDDGGLVEWFGTSTDIQDLKELQDRQDVLVAELQHRTRNLMGVVRSFGEQTARSSASLDEFMPVFRDRMDALARVNGLLSRLHGGDRVTFDELIGSEMKAMGSAATQDGRVTLEGPSGVALRSHTVQTFALALHELATNAVKYGALKAEDGPNTRLAVRWRVDEEDGRPWLHVDWRESGVTVPSEGALPKGGGAGRQLIERALPYQLKARTSFVMEADGVHCTIALPVSERGRVRKSADA